MKGVITLCSSVLLPIVLAATATTRAYAQAAPANLEERLLIPPTHFVSSTLFSPSGKSIAIVRYEGHTYGERTKPPVLQLWALPKGDLLWTAKKPVQHLLAFSPDGSLLAGVEQEHYSLVFWDTASGREKRTTHSRDEMALVGAFLPDGRTFVTGMNRSKGAGFLSGKIQFWDAWSGKPIRTVNGETNVISALAVSPDGKTLAFASWDPNSFGADVRVNLLDTSTDSLRHVLRFGSHIELVPSLAFSADRKILVAAAEVRARDGAFRYGEIKFWDVASGILRTTITDACISVQNTPLALSPDGETLASGGMIRNDQAVLLWNAETGRMKESRQADAHCCGRFTFLFVENGLLVARPNSCEQVEVQLWNYKQK